MGKKGFKVKPKYDWFFSKIVRKGLLYEERSGNIFFDLVFTSGKTDEEIIEELSKYDIAIYKNEIKYFRDVVRNPKRYASYLAYRLYENAVKGLGLRSVSASVILDYLILKFLPSILEKEDISMNEFTNLLKLKELTNRKLFDEEIQQEINKTFEELLKEKEEGVKDGFTQPN